MNRRNIDIERRSRCLLSGQHGKGPVVYWMSRDQRVTDNWALLWAQQEAIIRQKGLLVVFSMIADYPGATLRHYRFMLKGLETLQQKLNLFNISFRIFEQSPIEILPGFLQQIDAHVLVSDFDPLKIKRQWKEQLIFRLTVPFYETDTHNIIPAWVLSNKKEYAAYTIRPKVKRLLGDFLTDIPTVRYHPFDCKTGSVAVDVYRPAYNVADQWTGVNSFT